MNMWSAELKQRRGQGGKPEESDCGFSESEEFCPFERERLEKKIVPPQLKSYNLIYIRIIISIYIPRHFFTSWTLATIVWRFEGIWAVWKEQFIEWDLLSLLILKNVLGSISQGPFM